MEPQLVDAAKLRLSSSFSITPTTCLVKFPTEPPDAPKPIFLSVKAAKWSPETYPDGLLKKPEKNLSGILRTEAAISNIERKANSNKYNSLWPKAVLEALDEAIRGNEWESALKIFGLLRKQRWYEPRCQTYTKLLMMLGKCKQAEQASLLFEVMRFDGLSPTLDVYTALLSAYGLSGFLDKAFGVIDDMKSVSDCKPDVYTYSVLINCCIKNYRCDLIDRVLADMAYVGVECSTITYNTIIDGYGKAEMFESMESSLMDMIESGACLPDVFTLNSFIWAYGNSRQIEKMEKWYDEFLRMGITPDIKTFNILIRSYGKVRMFDKMVAVMEFMEKRYLSPTVVTFNTVIEMFGKAGKIEKMEKIFKKMKHEGMKPNSITYCSLVSAYSKDGNLNMVDSILRQVGNSDVVLDTPFFNSVISAYGQAGDLEQMNEAFLSMKGRKCKPDDITFATMIQAYNARGMVEAARDLEIMMNLQKEKSGTKRIGCY
ncbi:pentatricopeptide repeat-containing protein At3g53170 isoform X2 [Malania oleifera]|uniref:pentatricopeptide repeat-containing protein At3g53170 isoform X2 n=1 Tax=Malania oleifera TaxID=397392 RepID=UPI0025AE0DBA|nr:pentatricopeptide repeat-containing protein At3g53170 isoform X2 [Malania oleifera]